MGGHYLTKHENTFKNSTTKKNMMLVNKTNKSTNTEKKKKNIYIYRQTKFYTNVTYIEVS